MMISVFEHPWLGGLFGDGEVSELWSSNAQLGHFRSFERAFAHALTAAGRVAPDHGQAAARAIDAATLDTDALSAGTARDGVPVPELVRQLKAAADDVSDAVHTGATSQDVLDTALVLTLRSVTDILIDRLARLEKSLDHLRKTHGSKPLMGRTRMQAAVPITAGDRIGAWQNPLPDHLDALQQLRPRVERLQLGGAVGTRATFGDKAEEITDHVAKELGLQSGPAWHSNRTALADYASRLSTVTGTLGKMGQDVALMAQQGVNEIVLSAGGTSSAMPHKSNPVLAELLVTLARFNATQVPGMHHALIHEQERSGAAWMLEWMILPPMTLAAARALSAANDLCAQIVDIGDPKRA